VLSASVEYNFGAKGKRDLFAVDDSPRTFASDWP
jgi:hypothetical protein